MSGYPFCDFGPDFLVEIVIRVLGLPQTVKYWKVIMVNRSVDAEGLLARAFEGVLLDEVPAVGRAAALEEVGKGGAGVALGGVAVFCEGGEGVEVRLDGLVGGLEGEDGRHGCREGSTEAQGNVALRRGSSRVPRS